MRDDPFFSIVLATYKRGQCITPTIESVLRQTFSAFELIVVGDGCDDGTEAAVASFNSERILWRNLARNSGSQSFPNNEGIRCARGEWVCYIGHDDVWAPDHLARLRALIEQNRAIDFAVSGCIYYGPQGSEVYYVTGLFTGSDAAFKHFFPPSSIAHRRDTTARIGEWRDPRSIAPPVDCDFLLRAARAGLRFASTGRVTVHKFAAGHRYLSYLRQTDGEQRALLRVLNQGGDGDVEHLIEISKRAGRFMTMRYSFFSRYSKGRLYDLNRMNKGLKRPPLRPLMRRVVIEQSNEPRGLDWYGVERRSVLFRWWSRPFRWSGPSPSPKILIPFTGDQARVAIQIRSLKPGATPEGLSVLVEEQQVEHMMELRANGTLWLRFVAPLSRHDYTVASLRTPMMFRPSDVGGGKEESRMGVAAADMILDPLQ